MNHLPPEMRKAKQADDRWRIVRFLMKLLVTVATMLLLADLLKVGGW